MRTPELRIYTYREGLLSAVGHDLALSFDRFRVDLASERISASVELESLRVLGAVRRGEVTPGALSPEDRADIERSARDGVLQTARHPQTHFEGDVRLSGAKVEARGELTLHGKRRPWVASGALRAGSVVVDGEITPSKWGIAPFRALGGALKVRDRVRMVLTLPLEAEPPTALSGVELTWTLGGVAQPGA